MVKTRDSIMMQDRISKIGAFFSDRRKYEILIIKKKKLPKAYH